MKKFKLITLLFILALTLTDTSAKPPEFFKVVLKVKVLNDLGNIVEGAKVSLYKTEEDYLADTNQVKETVITDDDGEAKFKDLEPIEYFVYARKDGMSNRGMGEKTQELEKNRINKVTIVISEL